MRGLKIAPPQVPMQTVKSAKVKAGFIEVQDFNELTLGHLLKALAPFNLLARYLPRSAEGKICIAIIGDETLTNEQLENSFIIEKYPNSPLALMCQTRKKKEKK